MKVVTKKQFLNQCIVEAFRTVEVQPVANIYKEYKGLDVKIVLQAEETTLAGMSIEVCDMNLCFEGSVEEFWDMNKYSKDVTLERLSRVASWLEKRIWSSYTKYRCLSQFLDILRDRYVEYEGLAELDFGIEAEPLDGTYKLHLCLEAGACEPDDMKELMESVVEDWNDCCSKGLELRFKNTTDEDDVYNYTYEVYVG